MNTKQEWRQENIFEHGGLLAWSAPRNRCFKRCVEVEREAHAANRLRTLLAQMLEFVPPDHALAHAALDELD